MNEFDPDPPKLRDLDAAGRLILVLVASLALHLALILGVQVKAVGEKGGVHRVMEVRVERVAEAEVNAKLSTALPDKIEKKTVAAEATHRDEAATSKPADRPASPVAEPPASSLPMLEMPLLEDPTWYPAKQLDVHPVALNPIKPVYPEKGVELGVDGKVVLLLLIDESGMVKDASVVEADPEGIFEESALAAFRNARFAPAQKNGRAVKSRVLIRVSYELNDRKKPVIVQPPLPATP
ncbi:MAG TPA: TonB family protein [Sulfuricella sp.]|nr:TonB family protein [Sulfuricella sp.]